MAERYTKLYSLKANIYTETCPVVVVAGALLKDNNNGQILAQFKYKNISTKKIKALTVEVIAKDTVSRILGKPVVNQYLDLSITRDEEFGQKTAIPLPNMNTREYEIHITEVAFEDNDIWQSSDATSYNCLPCQPTLMKDNPELLKQYHMDINGKAKYELLTYKDLWLCACGAINHTAETKCHICKTDFSHMNDIDIRLLTEHCNNRLEEEHNKEEEAKRKAAEDAEKKRTEAEQKKKKIAKIRVIIVLIIVLITIGPVITTKVNNHKFALSLMDYGKYNKDFDKVLPLLKKCTGKYRREKDLTERTIGGPYYLNVNSFWVEKGKIMVDVQYDNNTGTLEIGTVDMLYLNDINYNFVISTSCINPYTNKNVSISIKIGPSKAYFQNITGGWSEVCVRE